jgi:hypothetical protein
MSTITIEKPRNFEREATFAPSPEPLTPEQLEDIRISRLQFAAGQWIDHDDLMKELEALYPDDEN